MKTSRSTLHSSLNNKQKGFTLIEVLISMVLLTIGFVALLGVFGMAMATTQTSQQNMIAKQLASEAMESIFTARNTTQLGWGQIDNVSNGGSFVDAQPWYPIDQSGADGIVGTNDDGPAEVLNEPGPDGIMGTADDIAVPLTNYQRKITISTVNDSSGNPIPSLREVTVTIRYTTPGFAFPKTYVLTSYISQYR